MNRKEIYVGTISPRNRLNLLIKSYFSKIFVIIAIYSLNSIITHALTVKSPREVRFSLSIFIDIIDSRFLEIDGILSNITKVMLVVCACLWTHDIITKNHKRIIMKLFIIPVGVVNIKLIYSVILLIATILEKQQKQNGDIRLLWDVYVVWISNIVLFSIWYWLIDSGEKPHFCFPIQSNELCGWEQKNLEEDNKWKPNLIDYWFLSFTTSTAFGPTDTFVLSRWGKILMMLQASTSLVVLVIIAAHAVNILRY